MNQTSGTPKTAGREVCVVYVLLCADGSLYTGWTNDLSLRSAAHASGRGSRYTRSRLPCRLFAWWETENRSAAMSEEARFKRLTRARKWELLERGEAFGRRLRNVSRMPTTYAPPTGTELDDLAEEAQGLQARIHTKKGDILFRFYANEARQHSAAFIKLARAGFYDGLTFHRVEPGFVIQGGCPQGTGTGGPGYNLNAEFNERPHVRGTVAMARSQSPNSGGSQFYICLGDARFLDRQYTVFGQTIEGQEVTDGIRVGDVMEKVTVEALPAK
jgi:peptidyl-prolyl cis-trans isomerase B (cyclophilin B)